MLGAIARFETRYHLRQPLFYILAGMFALLAFWGVADDDVTIGGGVGNVYRNAPYVTMQFMLVLGVFGVLTTTAFGVSPRSEIGARSLSALYGFFEYKVSFTARPTCGTSSV